MRTHPRFWGEPTAAYDYGCGIIWLTVLRPFSALGHFWYVMIAIYVVETLAGFEFRISRAFLAAKKMLARLSSPSFSDREDMEIYAYLRRVNLAEVLKDRDVGVGYDFGARDETLDEVMEREQQQARTDHRYETVPPELAENAMTEIRDEESSPA
jgi:hypothetical protein